MLYRPIDRELLEDLFQSDAVAESFRHVGSGVYEIQMRDTKILTKYNQPHSVVNFSDIAEVRRKEKKYIIVD